MATYPQQPFLYNGHLPTTATSLQWPPIHFTSLHFSTTVTSPQRRPLYNGHLSTSLHFTSLQRSPPHNGHLSTMATSLQQPIFFADSPYIDSCLNLFSLQWPVSSVPKVAAVEWFSCKTQFKAKQFLDPLRTL